MENSSQVQAKTKISFSIQKILGQKFIRDVLLVLDLNQNLLSVKPLV